MAQLYSWGARALFIGPAFGLSPHRNAVAVVALGLQAPFELARNTRDYRRCRSLLWRATRNCRRHVSRRYSGKRPVCQCGATNYGSLWVLPFGPCSGVRA